MSPIRPVARFASLFLFSTLIAAYAAPAAAETSGGFRVGFSSSPDQVLLGGQLNLEAVSSHVYIVPSGELGLGDDATTLSFNGDVQYRFDVQDKVRPYAGGGLTLYYINVDNGGSDTNLGVTILGGIFFGGRSSHPMFAEVKAGLTDEVPDWKFIFGMNF